MTLAEQIARHAHAGQTEESTGDPYVYHLQRVAALVEGDAAKAVAWLHDVIEDTAVTAGDLVMAGIPLDVLEAVVVLTRTEEETYADYIAEIETSGNPLALAVKIADLKDHLRPTCPARLRPRYERALQHLAPKLGVMTSDQ
jgi:(p)ppGpp synthase/HD superfamily hydrolase